MQLQKIRGVNLGGWLVLEKWMTPMLFDGLSARDETSFCQELGMQTASRLRPHHESFFTKEDFRWIADHGLNLVRIPVGHWLFGDKPPFPGAVDILDRAMDWARDCGLAVLIDLHAAQGCQNGFDNGGIQNRLDWHAFPENIDDSVGFIDRVAQRWGAHPALWGIQLLNEPKWEVPMDTLWAYYRRGHDAVRRHCGPQVQVVFHDGFRFALNGGDEGARINGDYLPDLQGKLTEIKIWDGFLPREQYPGVWMDTHIYQCHDERHQVMDLWDHLDMMRRREPMMGRMATQFDIFVGEWSLGLPDRALRGSGNPDHALRLYADMQLELYERLGGWVFWNYRLAPEQEARLPGWSYRACVERGWIPASY